MSKSCPQTDQTLLWLYGESEHDQTAHVANCIGCGSLLEDTTVISAASVTLRPKLARRRWPLIAAVVGLAAVVLLSLAPGPVTPPEPSPAIATVAVTNLLADDPLDDELLALAADFELLSLDFNNELL